MKSALLVVDVQRDVVADAYRRDAVIGNISELVNRARNLNVLISRIVTTGLLPNITII